MLFYEVMSQFVRNGKTGPRVVLSRRETLVVLAIEEKEKAIPFVVVLKLAVVTITEITSSSPKEGTFTGNN